MGVVCRGELCGVSSLLPCLPVWVLRLLALCSLSLPASASLVLGLHTRTTISAFPGEHFFLSLFAPNLDLKLTVGN